VKITKQGTTLVDTEDNKHRWRMRDLRPGDVFRYAAGKDDNIYVMGEDRCIFLLTTNARYGSERNGPNSFVVKYPNATLELGEEQSKRSIVERNEPTPVRIVPDEEL
jgi:hypothetical protein